jgi:rRNA maturation RNase YbeY
LKGGLSITNRTRRPAPRAPFADIARAILPDWELSLAFVGPAEAKRLNEALRRKDYVPNVLSYAAGARSGEVLICPAEAVRQAPEFGLSAHDFTVLLFIHGCLHLKGHPHGATMERHERTLLARFAKDAARVRTSTHVSTHRHRNRYRNVPGKTGRRRRAGR